MANLSWLKLSVNSFVHKHTHVRARTHTHTHTLIQKYMQMTHTHAYIHRYRCTQTHHTQYTHTGTFRHRCHEVRATACIKYTQDSFGRIWGLVCQKHCTQEFVGLCAPHYEGESSICNVKFDRWISWIVSGIMLYLCCISAHCSEGLWMQICRR